MWSLSEIKNKQKYIMERLKHCSNKEEKELLELSLISNISILNNSGAIRYTKFYNLMDKFTNNRFSLSRDSKYAKLEQDLLFDNKSYMDNSYLQFLITLTNNIAIDIPEEQSIKTHFNASIDQLVNSSRAFYKSLGNNEILQMAERTLDDSTAINVTETARNGFEDLGGVTYNDYIFNKSYINIHKSNTLFDFQALNHEVMHSVDFYIHPKVPSKNYFGFHEIPTYTIDYLFLDFMEQMGMPLDQVNELRKKKYNYLPELANLTLLQLKSQIIRSKGLKVGTNPTIDDIREVITPQLLKQLLEIESGIVAYGLKSQIDIDKEKGLKNLTSLMASDIPSEKKPDFSSIGLSDDILLNLSLEYRNNLVNTLSIDIKKR